MSSQALGAAAIYSVDPWLTFTLNFNVFDVWVMMAFGIIGYFMKKYDFPAAPMAVALVLGRMLEDNLYQAMVLAHGDITVFVTRPISATLLGISALMAALVTLKTIRMKRDLMDEEEG